jgi:ABC-type Fe3+ transport system permease subunit
MEDSGLVIINRSKMVFKIVLPLIKPALLTSFVLVFIFSISEFSVPSLFGLRVFTTEIFIQFSAFYNHSLAILQSLLLIVICVLLLFSERKYISDAPFLSIDSRGTNKQLYRLKKHRLLVKAYLFLWFIFTVVLPFLVLFVQSFKNGTNSFIQAYELLLPTFTTSVGLASLGALLIVVVGFTSAFHSLKQNQKSNSFDNLLLLIFAVPSTVFGISLIKFYNHPGLEIIYSGYAIIIIAWVGKFSFIASKIIGNAIRQIPKSLDEAAQIEGVSFHRRQIKILLPLLLPSLFAAFVIGFIFSLGELGSSIMVYPPGTELMPIKVFTIMANAPQSLTSSMSLIVFSLTLILISGFFFMVRPLAKKFGSNND